MECKFEDLDNVYPQNSLNEDNKLPLLHKFGPIITEPLYNKLKISFPITDEFSKKYISDFIFNVINNKDSNVIMFNLCIKTYIYRSSSIFRLIEFIYGVILQAIHSIKENIIQINIDNSTFNINTFINIRNHYYNKLNIINRHLSILNKHIVIKGHRILNIIRDYAFYKGFLNEKYNYKGSECYMFAILIDSIRENNKEDILNVFKVINTYNGFSYSVKERRSELFNPELDNQGQDNIISDNTLIMFVKTIDDNIKKSYSNDITKNEKKQLIDIIIDDIYMCKKIGNTDVFLMLYHEYLQKRLIGRYSNPDVESKLLEILYINNNKSNIMMEYCINDIKGSEFINREFKNIVLAFDSGKYSQQLQNIYNRDITTFNILRKNVWTLFNERERIYEPDLIKMHLDIFKKFYTSYFNERFNKYSDRSIEYNYDMSTVDMELSINDAKYNLHMNLLQASILGHINDNKCLSALELAETMNIQLKDINTEINSLLYSKIITRDSKYRNDDIEIVFFINPKFSAEHTDINLIEIMKTIKDYQDNKSNNDDDIYLNTQIKVMITDIISNDDNKSVNHNILYDTLVLDMNEHNDMKIKHMIMNEIIYENIILQMICSNIITKNNDNYIMSNCDSDLDLDSYSYDDIDTSIECTPIFNSNNSIDISIQNDDIEFSDITESDDEP